MSWSCVEAPWSLQEGNEEAAVPGDLPVEIQTLTGRVNHLSSLMGWEALELCPCVCQQSPEEALEQTLPGLLCVSHAVVCVSAVCHTEQAGQLLCAFSSSLHARHRVSSPVV